jgi:hypothetical protein
MNRSFNTLLLIALVAFEVAMFVNLNKVANTYLVGLSSPLVAVGYMLSAMLGVVALLYLVSVRPDDDPFRKGAEYLTRRLFGWC